LTGISLMKIDKDKHMHILLCVNDLLLRNKQKMGDTSKVAIDKFNSITCTTK